MFNQFFKGTVDDLLNMVCGAPKSEIDTVQDPNKMLNRQEAIDMVIDNCKCPREVAEALVTEAQQERLREILNDCLLKGYIVISEYDAEGQPRYKLTEKGKKAIGL